MFRRFFYLLVMISGSIYAQSFNASVSSTKVGESDQFQVSFSFEGEDINSLKSFTPPSFSNFLVLSGPNQSTSMQIINGAVSASISYSYYVQARSAGSFTIGSASIVYKGTTYKTDPIKIEVIKGSAQGKQDKQQDQAVSNKEISDNLFVRASSDKQKAYKGEQVTVTYKLYTRLNIASQMSISKLPQYSGFWAEELETSNNISFTTEVVNGKQFRVGVLKRVALFPTESGQLSVTPFELNVPVLIQKKRKTGNGSIFDDFFNDPFFSRGETVEYNAKSNTIKIDVQPLPGNSVPASFSGAVGQFDMNSQLNTTRTKTNEPISLKIDITGSGNIQLLNIPEINLPSGFEKYEPKSSEQVNRSSRVSGKKSIDYLLVPRTAGEKEIPSVEFSYFNPEKKSYVTLRTPSYTIKVDQGEKGTEYVYAGKTGVKQLGDDIRYIKTSEGDLDKKEEIVLYNFGFWVATVLPLFAAAGLVVWKKRDDRLSGNVQLMRYTKAQKIARTKLKKAKLLMEQKKQTEFYAEISQALFGYLEDKLHIPKSDFTVDRAVDELNSRNVDEALISQFRFCAERTDYIRFAPPEDASTAMNDIYNQSANVIIELEKSFHSQGKS